MVLVEQISLDVKDRKLLLALFDDGRASTTALGKRTGVSQEVVSYRLARLKRIGVLQGIIPIIDLSALGYDTYRLQLRFSALGKEQRESFLQEVRKISQLSWLVLLAGPWDVVLLFAVKSTQEFSGIYDGILKNCGAHIDDKLLTIVSKIQHLPPTMLLRGVRDPLVIGTTRGGHDLDEHQRAVLGKLLEDGRKPLLEIARELSLGVTTVRYHLEVLQKKRIILGFRPIINFELLGYDYLKTTIELQNTADKQRLEQLLLASDHVVYVTESLGRYDLEFECCFLSVNDLLNFMESLKAAVHIRSYEIIFGNKALVVNVLPGARQ